MEDSQLVKLAKEGHSEAVSQLYNKYFDPMYRYCYWQINRNHEDAQDLTHDIFIEMAKSIKNFKGEGSFKNWLYTIAKRQVNKWIKRKYDATLTPLFDNIPEPENFIDPEEQSKKIAVLETVLDVLKPNARKILQLRYLRNYTVAETAQELGLSESNVKVLSHRAFKKLQMERPPM